MSAAAAARWQLQLGRPTRRPLRPPLPPCLSLRYFWSASNQEQQQEAQGSTQQQLAAAQGYFRGLFDEPAAGGGAGAGAAHQRPAAKAVADPWAGRGPARKLSEPSPPS